MMRAMSLSELQQPLAGSLHGDDILFESVSTDSRGLAPGQLFVALKGEHFDGHEFLAAAAEAGASAALVSEPVCVAIPALQVEDTQLALGQLGAFNRQLFDGTLVGITGSCGKTSVKNMLSAMFRVAGPTLATSGNYNNEIGVPLTLLALSPEHEFAVVEMGAGRPGDIAYLCELAAPGISVLLNAMAAHLDGMGSVAGVARTKGEILAALDENGTAVFPRESEFTPLWRELASPARVIDFGFSPGAAVHASGLEMNESGTRFRLHAGEGSAAVHLPLPGRHNVANALAAAAAALAAGLTLAQIVQGLATVEATAGRLRRITGPGDLQIIDDSYNANPASVAAAIDVLADGTGRRLLVLGTMAELGPDSDRMHAEVGTYAAESGIDALWVTGPHTEQAAKAFGDRGCVFPDRESLCKALLVSLGDWDTVLVKGSRSAGMEQVLSALTSDTDGSEA